jgi:hypothetical protein
MIGLIAVLLLVWLALSILGAVIEGLFWLTIVGAVLFVGTAAYAAIRRRTGRQVQ